MRLTLPFILLICCGHLAAQNIDTLQLREEIENLHTFGEQKTYLQSIFEEDQRFRGTSSNDSLDFRHLISVSYYINRYGYPTKADFGQYSSTPWLVWVHNSVREIDRISFPIILKGYLKGEIKEAELRTYFLRGLYRYKKDDEGFRKIPLKELFEVCEVRVGEVVSVRDLLDAKAKADAFHLMEVTNETTWISEDVVREYDFNGKKIKKTYDGDRIKIIHKVDGHIYLLKVYADHSGEEVQLKEISPDRYKPLHQETDKYYEFSDDRIVYRDSNHTIKEYRRE